MTLLCGYGVGSTTPAAPSVAAGRPNGGRLAGVDVGTRTIGVALCDAGWSFATPDKTILRKKFAADLEALKALVAAQSVAGLVVGLPLNMDGSDSPRTQLVRAFARNLAPPIGRASCRERVCQYVYISAVDVSVKQKYISIIHLLLPHHPPYIHHIT